MNKTTKFFAAFASVALMSACSSEEPFVDGGAEDGAGNGQKAYLAVTINSTGDMGMGRSTDYEKPLYEDGAEFEHKVDCASFFFFDEEGNWVTSVEPNYAPSFGEDDPVNDNIEYMSTKNILVLEGLKGNKYPTYMLTVLNMEDFTAESTLAATTQKLSVYADNFKKENGKNVQNFVMSTSAYFGENANHDNKYYNVTKLNESNFKLTADEAQNNSPVDVYVERLAAKVQLTVNAPTEEINGKEFYVIEQTIAGGDNSNGTSGDGLANTKVYLEVIGWGLNSTAIDSYVGKQLKADWATTNPFTSWQSVDRYRSFWAYSRAYEGGANLDNYLSYTNIPALTTPASLDYAEYCYENTNAPENIYQQNNAGQKLVVNSKATHVVLRTKLYNANGEVQNIVEYRGVPYLEDSFKAYLLNSLKNSTKGLNYYYLADSKTEGDATVTDYTQVDVKDIAFVGKEGYEKVDIVLADAAKALYKKTVNEEGEVKFVKLEGADNDLAARLTAFQGDTPLIWHNQGTNLYFIPVEHNATAANKDKEGYYGVVRNHWYKISVNKFSKLGHGAYDPDDATIIIKPDTPEDPLYYVGAKINILNWRIISQNVEL